MKLTQGVVGNLVNRYRAVLKKCHLLNVFGTLVVAGLICGGVSGAQAEALTITTQEEWNAAVAGAPGNDITVNANVNFDSEKFTTGAFTVGSGHNVTIAEGEKKLWISGPLNVTKGKITIEGGGGQIYFTEDITLDVRQITSDTSATSGIVLLEPIISDGQGGTKGGTDGKIYAKKRLTLLGGTDLKASGGNVKANYLTIGDGTGDMGVVGGHLKIYGKTSAADANAVLLANNLSTSAGGDIQLGDDSGGSFGGSTTANFNISGSGTLAVFQDWKVGNVSIKDTSTLSVGNFSGAGGPSTSKSSLTVGILDVSGGANAVQVGGGSVLSVGTLKVSNDTVDGNINVSALGTVKASADNLVTQASDGVFSLNTASGGAGISGGFSGSNGVLMLDGTLTTAYTQDQLKTLSNALGIEVGFTKGTFSGDVNVSGSDSVVAQNNVVKIGDTNPLTGTVVARTIEASGGSTTLGVGTSGSLTILGSGTGAVASNASGAALTTITVGANGSLGLGSAAIAGTQGGTLGALNVSGTGAQAIVQQGTFKADAVNLASAGTLAVNGAGTLETKKLTATAGDSITVGTAGAAGTLKAEAVTMAGASLFMDPTWSVGGEHPGSYGSRAGLVFTKGVDGELTVGRASQLTLGTTEVDWLSTQLSLTHQWGVGVTAALGIYAPQTLAATGSIVVDGAAEGAQTGANKATFNQNSLLVVNAPAMLQNAALKGDGTASVLNVAKDAKLMVVGGNENETVKIVADFMTTGTGASRIDGNAWTGANLLTDSSMMKASVVDTKNTAADYQVKLARAGNASDVYPQLSEGGAGLVNALFDQHKRDVHSADAGIRFLSRAVADQGGTYVKDATDSARVIEGGARIGASAGASQATLGAVSAASTAIMSRTSLANPLSGAKATALVSDPESQNWKEESGLNAGDMQGGSIGLWIMPLYQSNSSWGMKAGNFKTGLTSDLFGVALGADYTLSDAFRLGLAFNIGGGHAQSRGDFYKTENDFNFWGVSLYGGYAANNLALMADVGYTGSYNKAKQELPSSMDMGDMKADIESSALTAGLRGEYKIPTEMLDITPYVGVRYTGISTQDYDTKAGGTVFKNSTDLQNVWTFPIGVSLSKELETSSGWTVKPQLDLGIIGAAGDLETRNTAKVKALATSADMKTQVVDGITFDTGLGLNVAKDNVSFGLTYNLQMSEHRTGHGVNALFRYEF